MADFNQVLGSVSKGFGTTVQVVIIAMIVIVVLIVIIGGLALYFWNKKRYNLRVEIKKTRSDGRVVSGEWGKGIFSSKRGVVYIKRNKMKAVPMKVFDIRRYLQGEDLLTVEQLGSEDFRPVLPSSFAHHKVTYKDEVTGKETEQLESILTIQVDTGLNKAWKTSFENASKRAYSLQSFISQFQVPIAIAIVLIAVFVGFAIIWTKIGSLCGA